MAAGREEPGVADQLAHREVGDALAQGHDLADAFMAGDERRVRLDRPVALDGVQIGVADAAGDQLDQGLSGGRRRHRNPLDDQVLAELLDYSCLHDCHVCCPLDVVVSIS